MQIRTPMEIITELIAATWSSSIPWGGALAMIRPSSVTTAQASMSAEASYFKEYFFMQQILDFFNYSLQDGLIGKGC